MQAYPEERRIAMKNKTSKKTEKGSIKKLGIGVLAALAIGAAVGGNTEDSAPAKTEPTKVEEQVIIEEVETPPAEVTETSESAPAPKVDPEKAFPEMLDQYNYVGSSESDKYHKPTCRWAKEINDTNLVHFDTEEKAAAAGYEPCGTCKP
jgi:hypothetical protein